MPSVKYFGLWPTPLTLGQVCPINGNPPTNEGFGEKSQPLVGLSLEDSMYFIWKVKRWRFDFDFTIDYDWEFIYDDASPSETGTLSVERSATIILEAQTEFGDTINSEIEIPCGLERWNSEDGNSSIVPRIYDGGIDITIGSSDSDFGSSNTILDSPSGPYFNLPTNISFSGQNLSTTFGLSMPEIPQELEDLFATFSGGFGQTNSTSFSSGSLDISEEETWAY
jgi:hypothetical protein